MNTCLRILLLVVALAGSSSVMAQDGNWMVTKVNQPAQLSGAGEAWETLAPGMAIADGSWVRTGERGMLLLERDGESILFKPGTLAAISSGMDGRPGTTVKQRSGALLLDIITRDAPHTQVQTPYLAAVVKGTRFEVRVSKLDAELEVQRGTVEVTHIVRGERIDVTAGQNARVGNGAALPIAFSGSPERPKSDWVSPAEPLVQPLASGEAPNRWGAELAPKLRGSVPDIPKAGLGILMSTLASFALAALILKRRSRPEEPTAGRIDALAPATTKAGPLRTSTDGPVAESALSTWALVGTVSACISGLFAIAIPGASLTAVVSAMVLALVVLSVIWLLRVRRLPELAGATAGTGASGHPN